MILYYKEREERKKKGKTMKNNSEQCDTAGFE
jgi:hypothetical protein